MRHEPAQRSDEPAASATRYALAVLARVGDRPAIRDDDQVPAIGRHRCTLTALALRKLPAHSPVGDELDALVESELPESGQYMAPVRGPFTRAARRNRRPADPARRHGQLRLQRLVLDLLGLRRDLRGQGTALAADPRRVPVSRERAGRRRGQLPERTAGRCGRPQDPDRAQLRCLCCKHDSACGGRRQDRRRLRADHPSGRDRRARVLARPGPGRRPDQRAGRARSRIRDDPGGVERRDPGRTATRGTPRVPRRLDCVPARHRRARGGRCRTRGDAASGDSTPFCRGTGRLDSRSGPRPSLRAAPALEPVLVDRLLRVRDGSARHRGLGVRPLIVVLGPADRDQPRARDPRPAPAHPRGLTHPGCAEAGRGGAAHGPALPRAARGARSRRRS